MILTGSNIEETGFRAVYGSGVSGAQTAQTFGPGQYCTFSFTIGSGDIVSVQLKINPSSSWIYYPGTAVFPPLKDMAEGPLQGILNYTSDHNFYFYSIRMNITSNVSAAIVFEGNVVTR